MGFDPTTKSLKDFRSTKTELLRRIPDMGFEPMRANTLRLECSSLDRSDNPVLTITVPQGYTVHYFLKRHYQNVGAVLRIHHRYVWGGRPPVLSNRRHLDLYIRHVCWRGWSV